MSQPWCFVFNHIGDLKSHSKKYNLSTLAVVRSIGRRNIPIILLTTAVRDAVTSSRYTKHIELCPLMHDSEQTLLEHLITLAGKYPGEKVLLPTVDECAYFTGKHYETLNKYFSIPAPDWHAIQQINNKRLQYVAADNLGIPTPETYFPTSMKDVEDLAGKLDNYPYVIKPNVSFEWKLDAARNKAKGKKGIQVDNKDQLIQFAEQVYIPGFDFMIQEVIGGRDERLVTFLGYFDKQHQANSWFLRKKVRQSPIDFGYCTFTRSCHNETVLEQSVQLLQAIQYQGVAGVEWKLDPATDTYKLIEINGRPVNTTGCAMAAGIDLPAIAYFDAIGRPLPAATEWDDNQCWAWLNKDFWSAKELIGLNRLTWRQWLSDIASVKADAIFAWDDPGMSFRYFSREIWTFLSPRLKTFQSQKPPIFYVKPK